MIIVKAYLELLLVLDDGMENVHLSAELPPLLQSLFKSVLPISQAVLLGSFGSLLSRLALQRY